jgi:DNA invertase Pin-like site-specific DNA recombinase
LVERNIIEVLAEFERELIVERTRAGLAAARTRGRRGGRPRKMDKDSHNGFVREGITGPSFRRAYKTVWSVHKMKKIVIIYIQFSVLDKK